MNNAMTPNAQENLLQAICSPSLSLNPGIAVYQRNRWAQAERALAISFPTLAKLLGEGFGRLSREFLLVCPNQFSDWGEWGEAFPDFIAAQVSTSHLAYLPETALLDWYIHIAGRAKNVELVTESISLLSELNPADVGAKFNTHIRFIWTHYPAFEIWKMHQADADFSSWSEKAREKLHKLNSSPQCLLISRRHWLATPTPIRDSEYKFMSSLLRGNSLLSALNELHDTDFDFSVWLSNALSNGWVTEFYPLPTHSLKDRIL
ncbi:MAG: putative DNA-binding domain-containing protein [Cellvibrio sp.]|uniref:HvfC/BufC family peptide modification chaperone n=1 Tax=Cellvibrio sp. TaxID=1965322 RepID=UPI002728B8DD|nr:putative DNA-binding domain-containing protein [Cellvibrio sp.]